MILNERSIEEMLVSASQPRTVLANPANTLPEGWREPLVLGQGFRHRYDQQVGQGGWEFHQLNDALSIAVVDFCAVSQIARAHRHDNHLVFCAMIEGQIEISAGAEGPGGNLAHGFCSFFGLASGEAVHTVYEASRPLRYVSVFLRRDRIRDVLGVDIEALPAIFRNYVLHRVPIGLRHVALGSGAGIAASQALECAYEGELRRLYLTAKSIEIVCSVIRSYTETAAIEAFALRRSDIDKVQDAKRLIEVNLGEPLSVAELAAAVGMSIRKLQHGFQSVFRGSVGQVYKQVRLSRAMALVSSSEMSMIDIAIECGYECPGSFTRAFKLAFGSNPTEVRTTALRAVRAEPLRPRDGVRSPGLHAARIN